MQNRVLRTMWVCKENKTKIAGKKSEKCKQCKQSEKCKTQPHSPLVKDVVEEAQKRSPWGGGDCFWAEAQLEKRKDIHPLLAAQLEGEASIGE